MSTEKQNKDNHALQVFSSSENFELAQRIGQALVKSNLVPKEYQNNLPNTLIALEMANRIGASPLMVMQHLNIINGRPSWSSTFIISAINSCGRFEPLQFRMKGSGDDLSCVAYTKDKKGNTLESPEVTMAMAKAEGWYGKSGSKWKTMPELMIRYRAAAFWGRLYAPELTMGMQSAEEVADAIFNAEANSQGKRFEEEEIVDAEVTETVSLEQTKEDPKEEAPTAEEPAPAEEPPPAEEPAQVVMEKPLPGRPFEEESKEEVPPQDDHVYSLFDMSRARRTNQI